MICGLVEMVGEERREDDVDLAGDGVGERIADDPLNALCQRGGFFGGADGVGVKVDSGEGDLDSSSGSPGVDGAESVAVATADVDDMKRLGCVGCHQLFEPRERRVVGEGEAIDPGDIVQTGAQLLVAAGLIHFFYEICTLGKIEVCSGH